MSSTEEPKPTEATPTETPAPTETSTAEVVAPVTVVPETAPEATILAKDPEVVAENLAKAEVVETPAEATTSAAAEETPTEAAPATPEKKEGSGLLSFIKKHVPNPKGGVDKKATAGKAATTETPAKSEIEPVAAPTTEPVIVEPEEETPFEGGIVGFKTHGGLFGGGWKQRQLLFGKEDPYSSNALLPYVTAHKAASYVSAADKTNAAWENAAHASVTGVGLLFLVKNKALDIPLNIINLAEVKEVTVNTSSFTIKTNHSGDYEFNTNNPANAKTWKAEIDKRVEQSKLTRSAVEEKEEYKTALESYKDPKAAHHQAKAPEAVTSDEEGALSGEETKRPSKGWSRRISGSFQRFAGPSKEAAGKETATDASKKEPSPAPVTEEAPVTETPVVEEVAPVTTETAPVETTEATTDSATESKKDKRKSLSGLTGFFGKHKAAPKEPSPEPTAAKATEPTPATEPAVEETTTPPVQSSEETPAVTSETKPETEKKRNSIFAGFKPKKETKDKATPAPTAIGEQTDTTEPTTSEAVATTEETPAATTSETPKKDGLGRRLTSSFKAFGRSKSPDKEKSTKVSDEAPKIDTAIESTPETTTAPEAAEKPQEEPLSTTEAPLAPVELPEEPKTAPVVSTQA